MIIKIKFFIGFSVKKHIEANSRFLLGNDNWSGLELKGYY
jgi:hypothetical protein